MVQIVARGASALRRRRTGVWAFHILALLTALHVPQLLFAQSCPPTPGNGKICTADDFNVTGTLVSGPSECTEGDTIAVSVRVGLEATAAERYDVAIFAGDNGEPVFDGLSCSYAALVPLEPPFDPLSGSGPYRNLDGDACGDVQKSDGVNYRDFTLSSVLCRDSDGDGRVDVSTMVSWSSNATQDVCSDPGDPASFFPEQSSKCQWDPELDLPIIVEPPPSLSVSKLAYPTSLPAPGGDVVFVVVLRNTSAPTDPVTLDVAGLVDDVHGNLDGQGTCELPQALAPGEWYLCEFVAPVTGAAGYTETDTVTAAAVDDEGELVNASDDATVTIEDAAATMEVVKVAAPASLPEPGGPVDYLVVVVNTSDTATLTVTDLEDDLYGDVFSKGTCVQSGVLTLAPGESFECSFTEPVIGQPGDVITDTVTASALASTGDALQVDAIAEVVIADVASAIAASKTATPSSLPEPGGTVSFEVVIQNVSPIDTVTLTSLTDDIYGDLDGQGTCAVPQTLPPGAIYRCAFSGPVSGNAGDRQVDVITASGTDDDGVDLSTQAAAEVVITDTPSAIEVVKTANPSQLQEPGGDVTFSITVANVSQVDSVTIESLVDDVYGDLDGAGTCAVPQVLAPGDTYSCAFTVTISGSVGFTQTDTVTAEGTDDDGQPISDSDSAVVEIVPGPPPVLPPEIAVTKLALPATLEEPGGEVSYVVQIDNLSLSTVRVTAILDDLYGDPGDPNNGLVNGSSGCTPPIEILPRERHLCVFQADVAGDPGDSVTDTITAEACALDGGGDCVEPALSASDDATVTILDLPSSIQVQKIASPTTVTEPGGPVTFSIDVQNASTVDVVTLGALGDDVYGDLNGQGDCVMPQVLQPAGQAGDRYSCTFTADVLGNDGDELTDIVVATGQDDDGAAVSALDSASVTITGALPTVEMTKTAAPAVIFAPGAEVTFTVTVTNTSTSDTLTITTLEDSVFGDLDGQGDCAIPQTLPPGGVYRCSFPGQVRGGGGELHVDTVTLVATSEDGESLSDTARAFVIIRSVADATGIPVASVWVLILTSMLALGIAAFFMRRQL